MRLLCVMGKVLICCKIRIEPSNGCKRCVMPNSNNLLSTKYDTSMTSTSFVHLFQWLAIFCAGLLIFLHAVVIMLLFQLFRQLELLCTSPK